MTDPLDVCAVCLAAIAGRGSRSPLWPLLREMMRDRARIRLLREVSQMQRATHTGCCCGDATPNPQSESEDEAT